MTQVCPDGEVDCTTLQQKDCKSTTYCVCLYPCCMTESIDVTHCMQVGSSQFEEVLQHASPGGIAEWQVLHPPHHHSQRPAESFHLALPLPRPHKISCCWAAQAIKLVISPSLPSLCSHALLGIQSCLAHPLLHCLHCRSCSLMAVPAEPGPELRQAPKDRVRAHAGAAEGDEASSAGGHSPPAPGHPR